MTNKKDGGPAFPIVEPDSWATSVTLGMSLRDYFAAKAMHGLLNGCLCEDCGTIKENVKEAYKIADAMLDEREK